MRNKVIIGLMVLAVSVGIVSAQESTGKYERGNWIRGFFLDFGVLYNFEHLEDSPKFNAHNLLLEIGGGYDFGRIIARLYGNFGFLLGGYAYWSNGTEPILEGLNASIGKFGIEAGIKIIDTNLFDLAIPIGLLFNWTTYTQKNPSYTSNKNPYDRKWEYDYMNIQSGIDIKFSLGRHFSLCIPLSIGYPLVKDYTYKEILRGNVVWSDTESSTYSDKNDVSVLSFSAGIAIRGNL